MSDRDQPVAGGEGWHSGDGVDEAFRALMEGLRTTLPGVQVLFGFLLILPMQQRFAEITSLERITYFVALIAAAVASVLLIAPSVHQRVRAPMTGVQRHHWGHLRFTAYLTIAGTVSFLLALASSVYLVATVVFAFGWAIIPTVGVALLAGWAWFSVPMVRWREDGRPDGV